ncbi:MAG: hypothetical protein MJZ81_04280, partial [Bacteroidales bacterium]|nr:hypothetical protein [Bacteroidales bacterium]
MSNISLSVLLLLFGASKRNRFCTQDVIAVRQNQQAASALTPQITAAHGTAMHLRASSQNRSKISS